jgi:hypothetical protein
MWLGRRWDHNGEATWCSSCHPHPSPSLGKAADIVVRLAWYGRTSTADVSISGIATLSGIACIQIALSLRPQRSLPLPSPLALSRVVDYMY